MSHVGIDMLIGSASEPMILVCVPLKEESIICMSVSRHWSHNCLLYFPSCSPWPQSPPAPQPELLRSLLPAGNGHCLEKQTEQ